MAGLPQRGHPVRARPLPGHLVRERGSRHERADGARAVAWTEERGTSDEGRQRLESATAVSGQQGTSDEGRDRLQAPRGLSGKHSMPHRSLAGQLAAMGFTDTGHAQRLLTGLGFGESGNSGDDGPLLSALAAAADPDQALAALARMAPGPDLLAALRTDERLRDRLTTVLGASAALGNHLARHPADWRLLAGEAAFPSCTAQDVRADLLAAVGADPDQAEPVADRAGGDPATRLRAGYRRWLLRLAAADLTGELPLDAVMAWLADLTVAALDAALAIARADLPAGG